MSTTLISWRLPRLKMAQSLAYTCNLVILHEHEKSIDICIVIHTRDFQN